MTNQEIEIRFCPYCKSKDFVRNGFVKGKQRYICRNQKCNKTFRPVSINSYEKQTCQLYLEGLSVKRIHQLSNQHVSEKRIRVLFDKVKGFLYSYRRNYPLTPEYVYDIEDLGSKVNSIINSKKAHFGSGVLIIGLDNSNPYSHIIEVRKQKDGELKEE